MKIRQLLFALLVLMFGAGLSAAAQSCAEIEEQVAKKRIEHSAQIAVLSELPSLSTRCDTFAFYRLSRPTGERVSPTYQVAHVVRWIDGEAINVSERVYDSIACTALSPAIRSLAELDVPQPFVRGVHDQNNGGPGMFYLDGVSYRVSFKDAGVGEGRADFGASVSFRSWGDLNPSVRKWWRVHGRALRACGEN